MAETYVANAAGNLQAPAAEAERKIRSSVWSLAQRIGFRFVFCYFVLYIFPFPFGGYPGRVLPFDFYDKMWYALVPWMARYILRLSKPITIFPNGSGDTTFNYVQLLCFLVIAAVATIIWTALDRKRAEYRTLHEWLRIYVRYALAFTMLAYGMDKVIKLQFADPGLGRLAEPFGNYSPFALLWTFMGYSTPYTHFGGWGEVIGAVLLFFRRTTTLGALILCGVLANVVALNYFYDVPVKVFSTHLWLMAVFLAAGDWRRIANFFLLNRAVPQAEADFPVRARWAKISHVAVKAIVLLTVAYFAVFPWSLNRRAIRQNIPRPPIYGLYQVESFTQAGKPVAWNDADWRRIIFEYRSSMEALSLDDTASYYAAKYDEAKNSLTLTAQGNKTPDGVLAYSRPDADHLELRGTWRGQPAVIEARKIDASKFELVSRGFHWINEHPEYQ